MTKNHLVPLNDDVKTYLINKNIRYLNFEDFYDRANKDVISKHSEIWARDWVSEESDVLRSLNLSLHHFFAKRLYLLESLNSLLDKERPTTVYIDREKKGVKSFFVFDHETLSPLIEFLCKEKGIRVKKNKTVEINLIKHLIQLLKPPKIKSLNSFAVFGDEDVTLFLAHHYHILGCFPLIKKFEKKSLLVVGRVGQAEPELVKSGVRFLNYTGEVNLSSLIFNLVLKFRYFILLRSISRSIYKYKNFDLYPIFSDKLISVVIGDALNLENYKSYFSYLLRNLNVKQVVAVTNDSTNQIMLREANKNKIPTFEIQHGLHVGIDSKYLVANIFEVWGESTKKLCEKFGVDAKRLIVGGWPNFDKLNKFNSKRDFKSSKLEILYLHHQAEGFSSQNKFNNTEKTFKIILASLRDTAINANIIVRLHPRTSDKVLKAIAKKEKLKIYFDENSDLVSLLECSDVIIGQTTTATLYALLMGKPVIYFPSMIFSKKFLENSGVPVAKNKTELNLCLETILRSRSATKNSKIAKFLLDYCSFGTNSSDKIFNMLKRTEYELN